MLAQARGNRAHLLPRGALQLQGVALPQALRRHLHRHEPHVVRAGEGHSGEVQPRALWLDRQPQRVGRRALAAASGPGHRRAAAAATCLAFHGVQPGLQHQIWARRHQQAAAACHCVVQQPLRLGATSCVAAAARLHRPRPRALGGRAAVVGRGCGCGGARCSTAGGPADVRLEPHELLLVAAEGMALRVGAARGVELGVGEGQGDVHKLRAGGEGGGGGRLGLGA
jgi:hypothetical protein